MVTIPYAHLTIRTVPRFLLPPPRRKDPTMAADPLATDRSRAANVLATAIAQMSEDERRSTARVLAEVGRAEQRDDVARVILATGIAVASPTPAHLAEAVDQLETTRERDKLARSLHKSNYPITEALAVAADWLRSGEIVFAFLATRTIS